MPTIPPLHRPRLFVWVGLLLLIGLWATRPATAQVSNGLTVTPITWDVIGLDSNNPPVGPNLFPVGARVCNTSGGALTNVLISFNLGAGNTGIAARSGSLTSFTVPSLANGACTDAYFEVEVALSTPYDATRDYTITAVSGSSNGSTATRRLVVERLISQNRNATINVEFGTTLGGLTSVAAGGTMTLNVGQTYFIRLTAATATQGYEQLESFMTLRNTIFRILSVSTTYSANTAPISRVPNPNPRLYANACDWDSNPASPNYLSCLSTGKAGGNITVTYEVQIVSGGGTTERLSSLIYDFSGSSFHYNADLESGVRFAAIVDPAAARIAKAFTPATIGVNGTSRLVFTLTNPNGGPLSLANFTDTLPTSPAAMVVAATPNAVSTCGGTITATAGSGTISFSGGTIPANSSCTVAVNVTAPTVGPYNNVSSNLFIGSVDTGDNAAATLNVSSVAPPQCLTFTPFTTWDFPNGSNVNTPAPTTGIGSASIGTGLTGTTSLNNSSVVGAGTNSWSADNIATGPLVLGNNEFFQFSVPTTGITNLQVSFFAQSSSNGPQSLQLYYGSSTGTENSLAVEAVPVNNWPTSPYTYTISTGLNPAGNTIFRIYAFNSILNNNGHRINIDGVTFSNCTALTQQPTLTKAFSPAAIGLSAASVSTLTFTLTNPNTVALTAAQFTDTLPTGIQVAAAPSASTTCTGGTVTAAAGSGSISLSGGTIPASGSCTVAVNVVGTVAGQYTNVSNALQTQQSGTNTTPSGIAVANITVLAPPVINKEFATSPLLGGGTSALTLTITNPNGAGTPDLTGIAFTDTLPAGMTIATPPALANTCGGTPTAAANSTSVALSGGTLAPGASCTVTVNVSVPAPSGTADVAYPNSVTVSHIVNAVTITGNTDDDTLIARPLRPGISVLKQVGLSATGPWFSEVSAAVGGNVFYQFTIENTGDTPLTSVTISDPAFTTAQRAACNFASIPVAVAANDNHIVTCQIGPVAVGGERVTNTATASGTGGTQTVTSGPSSAIYTTPELTLDKTSPQTTFATVGDVLTYQYRVENTGGSVLNGPITVNDNRTTVTCPAVTTVGDLDAFFDPGEVINCSASYVVVAGDVTAGNVTNVATATTTTTVGTVTVNSNSDTVIIPLAQPDLTIDKDDAGATFTAGGTGTYTITVTNSGGAASTGLVTVSDTLPTGLTLAAPLPTGTGWTCGGVAGDSSFSCTRSDALSPSANYPAITVTVRVAANATGAVDNTATVSGGGDAVPGNNSNTENTPITPIVDLTIDKDDAGATFTAGSTGTYTITVTNSGGAASTGTVTVIDPLPTGYVLDAAPTAPGWSCFGIAGSPSINCQRSDTLNPGDSYPAITIVVRVPANATGAVDNTATVSGGGDAVPGNNSNTENTPITPIVDLTIDKDDAGATFTAGGTGTYTITVTNSGGAASTGTVTVIDPLPTGYVLDAAPTAPGWSCFGIAGSPSINCQRSDALNPGDSYPAITIVVRVPANATGAVDNTATVSGGGDAVPGNNSNTENTPLSQSADLSLTKDISAGPYTVGDTVTFTLTVSNAGPSDATGVTVLDQLPTGFTFVSANPAADYDAGTGLWTIGTIASGNTATLTITATINATGSYTNVAQVSTSDTPDTDSTPGNSDINEDDQDDVTITPGASADLSLTKTVSTGPYTVGDTVTFTLTVSNAGPSDATGVTVLDQLPTGFTFVSANPAADYDAGTGLWTIGTIASGNTATLTITATINASGSYTNIAQVNASDTPDPNSTPGNSVPTENDQDDVTITPGASADLSLTKDISAGPYTVGDTVTFTLTVSNAGPSTATGVTVLDQLPTGFTFVSANPAADYDAGTGLWTIGTIASGNTATLTITATINATGSYTNVAQVSTSDTPDPDPTNNQDDVTITPGASADLSLTKTISTGPYTVGDTVTFTLTVSNAGPSDATGVTVLDQLPTGFTFVSSNTAQGSYDAGTGLWTIGTIASGDTATLTIDATINATGSYTNVAQVSASGTPDPNSTPGNSVPTENDQDDVTITPGASADLSLIKDISAGPYTVGDTVTFTLTVSNAGPSTATGVTVLDQLPTGFTFVSSNTAQGSYVAGTGLWTIGTIASGNTATLTIDATINATGSYTNIAQVSTSGTPDTDSTPGNNDTNEDDQDDVTITPGASADLSLTKTVSTGPYTVGDTVTFTLTVSNAGPSDATGVTVLDQLPTGFTFVSSNTAQGSYDAGTGLWTIGTIASGDTATLTITATINATGSYTNVAEITTSDTPDTDSTPGNNDTNEDDQDDVTITPGASADLSLTKDISVGPYTVGDTVTFTLTVSNAGPSAATGVTVLDQLPTGFTFVSANPAADYDAGTGLWTIGTIASGNTATLTITATINASGSYTNIAEITTSDTPDPDPTNNQDDVTITPGASADLSLTKDISAGPYTVGDTVTFTLTVSNAGPSDTTGVTVLDQLPTGFTFVSANPAADYDAGTGLWTIGTIASGNTATLTIDATINATGSYTNIAQVSTSGTPDTDSTPGNSDTNEDDQDEVTITPGASADLSLTKDISAGPYTVGDTVTFTLTVSNAGPSDATGVTVLDQLPTGFTFVSANPAVEYDAGTGIWTVGTVNVGAVNARVLTITATINATGSYTNVAEITTSDTPDPNSTPGNSVPTENDQDDVTITPGNTANLSLTKMVDNPNPVVGSVITYTVTVSNAGPASATNVIVLDPLPAGVTFGSATPSKGIYDPNTGLWAVGTINNLASATLQITVRVDVATPVTNAAQVAAVDQPDPNSTPNNGYENGEDDTARVTTPQTVADLRLTSTVNTTTPTVGQPVIFTLTLENQGPSNATGIRISNVLGSGFTFVSAVAGQGSYDPATGVWTVGSLAVNGTLTLQITATVNATGSYINTAQVSATDQFDIDSTPNNNVPAEDDQTAQTVLPGTVAQPPPTGVPPTPVIAIVDPFITKSVNPPFTQPGERVTWTIIVTNPGTLAVTNVVVSDVMPAEVAVENARATGGSVVVSGQRVTTSIPTLTGGQSVTITIDARVRSDVRLPFVITNTASITNAENTTPRTVQATVLSATTLPSTGETPALPLWFVIGVGMSAAIVSVIGVLRWSQRSR